MKIRFLIACSMALLISHCILSQNLIESRETSYYTYIFKLTNDEMKKLCRNGGYIQDYSFFHTQVDSFPTDSVYTKPLPIGHYMTYFIDGNTANTSLTSVTNCSVFVHNNNTDLCVSVLDSAGSPIPDAKVKIRLKTLKYDKKTEMYIDKKSNKKGILQVTHNGYSSYHNIERKYNNPAIKRVAGKLIFSAPIKYVWWPVRNTVFFPVDIIKSIIKLRFYGRVWLWKNRIISLST